MGTFRRGTRINCQCSHERQYGHYLVTGLAGDTPQGSLHALPSNFEATGNEQIRLGDGRRESPRLPGTARQLEAPGALSHGANESGTVRASFRCRELDVDALGLSACPYREPRRSDEEDRA